MFWFHYCSPQYSTLVLCLHRYNIHCTSMFWFHKCSPHYSPLLLCLQTVNIHCTSMFWFYKYSPQYWLLLLCLQMFNIHKCSLYCTPPLLCLKFSQHDIGTGVPILFFIIIHCAEIFKHLQDGMYFDMKQCQSEVCPSN